MGPAILAIIAATILVTSFISGIFGMAGGIILLGVLLIFIDVAPAMMLFGTIQTAANGWRAALWLRYVDWGIVWRYPGRLDADVPGAALGGDHAEQGRHLSRTRASSRSPPTSCRSA